MQVVVYLRPTDSDLVQQTTFTAYRLRHEFDVVRLWEQHRDFLSASGAVALRCPESN